MVSGIAASLSGLRAASAGIGQSAHNLANLSTTGYTPGRLSYANQAGGGVAVSGVSYYGTGPIISSDNPLDLAISGAGYFMLDDGQGGRLYSRSGALTFNAQGQLVDSQGRSLTPAVTIPPEAVQVQVSPQGLVQAVGTDGRVIYEAQIQVANFANPGGLQSVGGNAFAATEASGQAQTGIPGLGGLGEIVSGALQASGTDLVTEMVNMTLDQRMFEANLKALETQDKTLGTILDVVG